MKTILFATDLSEQAMPAQAVAVALARALGARLEIFHVVHMPSTGILDGRNATLVDDMRKRAEGQLAERANALLAQGVNAGAAVHLGAVDLGILDRAQEIRADLIVVGTYGRKRVARLFLGSVAERIVHAAPCPVLVAPPTTSDSFARGFLTEQTLRVIVGVDRSPASDAALTWLRDLKQKIACDVGLLHLYWPLREHERLGLGPCDPHKVDPELAAVLTRELHEHVAAHLGDGKFDLRLRPMWGDEECSLVSEAKTDGAALLVLGTNQARGGSTAIAAVREAALPVLCVPAKTLPAADLVRDDEPAVTEVMVTTDLSALGNAAVPAAYRLVSSRGGVVILAYVAPESPPPGLSPEARKEIEVKLLALIPRDVDSCRINSRAFVAENDSPSDAILQAVRRFSPDVLVMSSHGRSGPSRLVRGSVTERVLRDSPRPVLVVSATAAASADLHRRIPVSEI